MLRRDGDKVQIDFEMLTDGGTINFKGSMDKDEVEFVLQFGLLTLLKQGARVRSVGVQFENHAPDSTPPTMN